MANTRINIANYRRLVSISKIDRVAEYLACYICNCNNIQFPSNLNLAILYFERLRMDMTKGSI